MNEQQKNQSEEVFRDVASSITSLRQYRRISIEDAAEQIGMPVKKLEAIERGTFFNNTPALCRIVEALGGRLAILPTDNPGLKHCEFIAGPPVKKPHPCTGCDHFNRLENYCDFWEVDITDDFKCTNQKKQPFIVPQTKIYAK